MHYARRTLLDALCSIYGNTLSTASRLPGVLGNLPTAELLTKQLRGAIAAAKVGFVDIGSLNMLESSASIGLDSTAMSGDG